LLFWFRVQTNRSLISCIVFIMGSKTKRKEKERQANRDAKPANRSPLEDNIDESNNDQKEKNGANEDVFFDATESSESNGNEKDSSLENMSDLQKSLKDYVISPRSCTGVLISHPSSRDVKIDKFSLGLCGQELILDTLLEFNYGRRYGLIGLNGSGKSTLLSCMSHREIPIPEHITIFHLEKEMPATDMTAVEAVMADLDVEKTKVGSGG